MKYDSIKTVCLVVLACVVVFSVAANERTANFTSIILESFNGDVTHEWHDGRHPRSFDFSWGVDASRFATTTDDVSYPVISSINTWPQALYGINREGRVINSLGIHGRFDRRGHNWIDIYPVQGEGAEAQPFEIPLPGRVQRMDMWIWGSNLDYTLEAYVRDYHGVVHIIPLGSLAYAGWRNLQARIPDSIQQTKRILPSYAPLHFVKFRVWTTPREYVNNFYIYFNQFRILTDTFEQLIDGSELADPDIIPQLWSSDNGSN
ncbi:MAG: flagellar filament outer layer protein FlaA [Treponema sp.]|nr:flagellar filament outer layer protein FlaA [Treponema sp.]